MDGDGSPLHAGLITALRRAATIAHTVAGIAVTLRTQGRVLATVVPGAPHDPRPGHPAGGVVLSPCAFRNAVAKAWADHEAGQRVALVGQDGDGLEIDWSLRRPGALLGFGGVRTHCSGRMVWAMASVLRPDALAAVLDPAAYMADGDGSTALFVVDGFAARMLHDELLDVSVVHVEAEHVSPPLVAAIDEVITRFVATSAAAELLDSLATNSY